MYTGVEDNAKVPAGEMWGDESESVFIPGSRNVIYWSNDFALNDRNIVDFLEREVKL